MKRFKIEEGSSISYRDAADEFNAAQLHARSYDTGAYAKQTYGNRWSVTLNGVAYRWARDTFKVTAVNS
jgi:hypothetical protein